MASFGRGRPPALWAMLVLIAASAVWRGFELFGRGGARAGQAGVALFIWSSYAAVLAALVVKLARRVRIRPGTAGLAVLWGVAAAALSQLFALGTRDAIANALGPAYEAWTSALAAPLPEEGFKALGVVLLMAAIPVLRSPLWGMVLGALVGIGFNAAEGLAFSVSEMAKSGSWEPLWSDLLVRGLLTGLVTHAGLAAVVGSGIGYLFGAVDIPAVRRVTVFAALFVSAVLLHTLVDTPLLDDWGIGGVVVKQLPVVVAFWGVKDLGRSEYLRVLRRNREA